MSRVECWCCGRFIKVPKLCDCILSCQMNPNMKRYQPSKKTIKEIQYELYYELKHDNNYRHPEYIIVELDE